MSDFGFFYVVGTTETVVDPAITTLEGALNWLSTTTNIELHDSYVIQLDGDEGVASRKILQCSDDNKQVTVKIRRFNAADSSTAAAVITFTGTTTDGMLEVGKGVTLILDNKITVSGEGSPSMDDAYSGFIVVQGGTLRMLTGSTITKVAAASSSAAVTVGPLSAVNVASLFELQGGKITGNITDIANSPWTAPASHGAVLLRRNGQFTMSGASEITNNTRGVVIAGPDASFTMSGGSITGNGKILENGAVTDYAEGMRGAGVCVGQNLYKGTFTMEGGEISGNGLPGDTTKNKPPGGGVYVTSRTSSLILKGLVTINQNNTVCLTSASSGECPFITLGPGFTVSNPKITLDLASTRPEWVIKWVGKKVLQLDSGTTPIPLDLRKRFELRNFYESSGNKPFKPYEGDNLSEKYMIDDQGVLVLKPQPNPSA